MIRLVRDDKSRVFDLILEAMKLLTFHAITPEQRATVLTQLASMAASPSDIDVDCCFESNKATLDTKLTISVHFVGESEIHIGSARH